MPENKAYTRRVFLKIAGVAAIGTALDHFLLPTRNSFAESSSAWDGLRRNLLKKIPQGNYDVLFYASPGDGSRQKFLYLLDVQSGLAPLIYAVGVEYLGNKNLDDVISQIEMQIPSSHEAMEVEVGTIKKGDEVHGFTIYTLPYNESVNIKKNIYTLTPILASDGRGGAGGAGDAGGGGGCG
jgi:hypothetical protein